MLLGDTPKILEFATIQSGQKTMPERSVQNLRGLDKANGFYRDISSVRLRLIVSEKFYHIV